MSVKIIIDSSADLPGSVIRDYEFVVVPLSVHFGDEAYLDGVEITPAEFYQKLKAADDVPTTSQVPPERFIEYIKPQLALGHEVLVITIGSNASGTCQAAHIAKEELGDSKVRILDSNALCLGVGYIAIEAGKLAKAGHNADEIIERIEPLTKNRVEHLFCVDTLEYLKKGGRIKASKATVAEILNIKPILNVKDAITETIHKVRGRKKIIPYYIERMKSDLDLTSDMILVAHSQDPEFADLLIETLRSDLGWEKEIIVSEIGATIGTHTGPGVLACFYKKK